MAAAQLKQIYIAKGLLGFPVAGVGAKAEAPKAERDREGVQPFEPNATPQLLCNTRRKYVSSYFGLRAMVGNSGCSILVYVGSLELELVAVGGGYSRGRGHTL